MLDYEYDANDLELRNQSFVGTQTNQLTKSQYLVKLKNVWNTQLATFGLWNVPNLRDTSFSEEPLDADGSEAQFLLNYMAG